MDGRHGSERQHCNLRPLIHVDALLQPLLNYHDDDDINDDNDINDNDDGDLGHDHKLFCRSVTAPDDEDDDESNLEKHGRIHFVSGKMGQREPKCTLMDESTW